MITPRLEKAILSGWATFRTINHAFGAFGSIKIPKDHTCIITSIKWNHFLNPIGESLSGTTWAELFAYNEFQLKIDSVKSTNFLQFRNSFELKSSDPNKSINLGDNIDLNLLNKFLYIVEHNPIQQDVFFACTDFINLTISRNAFTTVASSNFAPLSSNANQKPLPAGVGGENVLLDTKLQNQNSDNYNYVPVSYKNANMSIIPSNQTMESYTQPYSKDSMLRDITVLQGMLFHTTPLIELGIVMFNKSYSDRIINS